MNTAIAKPVPKHILIVDDSFDNQNLLKLLLESSGYIVECTRNGEEALSLLNSKTLPHLPNLIVTDLQMPVMDGRELVRHLRTNSRFKSIPVVVMTGSEQTVQLDNDHGVAEVLIKPLQFHSFRDTIGRVLS